MAFSVEEFHDLVRLLEERPEWRAELRRLVLSEELLGLPDVVRELAEAQRRTEARLGELAGRVEELARAQRQTEARLGELAAAVQTLVVDVGDLKQDSLERRYRERSYAYFSRIVLRAHTLSPDELVKIIEDAVEAGRLSDEEADDLKLADVIVRGRRREDGEQVYLVGEVSWGVGLDDVRRAVERAGLLARAGYPALPVVAGKFISPDAGRMAQSLKVWQVTDGRAVAPEAA